MSNDKVTGAAKISIVPASASGVATIQRAVAEAIATPPDPPCAITVFRSKRFPLAKTIHADGTTARVSIGEIFDFDTLALASLDDVREILDTLQNHGNVAVLRGQVIDGPKLLDGRRLKHSKEGAPATLRDVARRWLAIDVDSLPLPEGVTPQNLAGCGRAAIATLPGPFRNARVLVQATASHGIKPGVRLRLWFWLSRPLSGDELKAWLLRAPVDGSVFDAVEPIFTAPPHFADGRPDPFPHRILEIPGSETVIAPTFGEMGDLLEASQARCAGGPAPDCVDLAAPSVPALIRLLNGMANPSAVDRDTFIKIAAAAAGARAGLIARDGPIAMADDDGITAAWVVWTMRWAPADGRAVDAPEVVAAKWKDDLCRAHAGQHSGWRHLLQHAQNLGTDPVLLRDLVADHAADQFRGEAPPPGLDLGHQAAKPHTSSNITKETILSGIEAAQRLKVGNLLSLADMRALPPPTWLIEGLLPSNGLVVPYGAPKSGKTFLVLSMALHVAAGQPWMGRDVEPGAVVYVAGEGIGGVSVRLAAMQAEYRIADSAPLWVLPDSINFADPESVQVLIERVQETVPARMPVRMVVFDTLARMIPGMDENSAQAMGTAVQAADKVRKVFDCAIVLVHHSGKDEARGMRGSNALGGGVETSLHIERDGPSGMVRATVEYQKEGEAGEAMVFAMKRVEVGERDTLVPLLIDQPAPVATAKTAKVTGHAKVALDALQTAMIAHGMPLPAGVGVAARGVDADAWRDELNRRLPDKPGETDKQRRDRKSQAFGRATEALQSKGVIGFRDGWAWLRAGERRAAAEDVFTAVSL